MKPWISVTWSDQLGYRARWRWPEGRGPLTARGRNDDIRRKVPPDWLRARGVDPDQPSERAEKQALLWAAENVPETKLTEAGPQPLAGVMEIYARLNPEHVAAITITKTKEQAKHLADYFAGTPADRITYATAIEYRNLRLARGAAPRTVRNELATLLQLIRFAAMVPELSGIESVRLTKLPPVAKPDREKFALTEEEFAALLAVPLDRFQERTRAVLIVGVTTMLRRNVLFGLRKEWLDLKRRWLTIPAANMKGMRGSKRRLSVPISELTADTLEPLIRGESPFVFPSHESDEAHMQKAGGTFHVLAAAIDLRRNGQRVYFTTHDLRRTGATWLEAHGVDKLTRKALLGHATDADVTDLYTAQGEETLRRAVGVFDEIRQELRSGSSSADGCGETIARLPRQRE